MPDGAGWAGTRRGSGIVGIGCTARDCIVTAAPSEIATFLLTQPWERSVTIGISEAQRLASLRFGASHGCHDWTAGGTLPNTLCAAASARDAHGLPLGSISWRGNAEYGDSVLSDLGVAHMREWGIDVQPTYPPGFVREAYCFVDAVTRDVRRISIYEQAAQIAPLQDWTVHDVVIMTVGDLVRADDKLLDCVRRCHRLALLVADWRPLPGSNALGELLERLGNLAFMVGQERDFFELGLCDPQTRTFDPRLDKVEYMGTNGPEPVVWKKSGAVNGARLPLESGSRDTQNALGAGDGYAGAFLACRIAGLNSVTAHAHASSHAMHVMQSGMSYVSQSRDLNCVFPPTDRAPKCEHC